MLKGHVVVGFNLLDDLGYLLVVIRNQRKTAHVAVDRCYGSLKDTHSTADGQGVVIQLLGL